MTESQLHAARTHRCQHCRRVVERTIVKTTRDGFVVTATCHGDTEAMLITPADLEDRRGSMWWFRDAEPPTQRIELHVFIHTEEKQHE